MFNIKEIEAKVKDNSDFLYLGYGYSLFYGKIIHGPDEICYLNINKITIKGITKNEEIIVAINDGKNIVIPANKMIHLLSYCGRNNIPVIEQMQKTQK